MNKNLPLRIATTASLLLLGLLSSATAFAQKVTYVASSSGENFTFSTSEGHLRIQMVPYKHLPWIDINNNGTCEGDEEAIQENGSYYLDLQLPGSGEYTVYCDGVTKIDLSYHGISDLDLVNITSLKELNVSNCYNLETLSLDNHSLATLNASNCSKLKSLSCQKNELTSLDVSSCSALETLNCSSNQLTALDVSTCPALTRIECGVNEISSLDVSACTELKELYVIGCSALTNLYCGSNQLTTLDVSDCSALKDLFCYKNQLTTLGLTGCTALTKLECSNNQLTALDVSSCAALKELYCSGNQLTALDVSSCPALTKLYCSGNQLTTLDVSSCPALTKLLCNDNQLTTLNLTGCTALGNLNCQNNQLTKLDVSACPALTELNVRKNAALSTLKVDGCKALSKLYVLDCKALTSLDVSSCPALTELAVIGCSALTKLSCTHTKLSTLYLTSCTALKELDCSGNQLTKLDVTNCSVLTKLTCYSNQLTSLDVSYCTALTLLFCYDNQLTTLDVSKNTHLFWLDCSGNQLTSLDVNKNTALQELDCFYNQLTTLDVSTCTELNTLDCSGNLIEDAAMTELVKSLVDKTGVYQGIFRVYDKTIAQEGNVVGKDNVAKAKAKNWEVQSYEGTDANGFAIYTLYDGVTIKSLVTYSAGANGTLTATVTSGAEVEKGTPVTFTATPDTGYKLKEWTVNGIAQASKEPTLTLTIEAQTDVKVTFEKIEEEPIVVEKFAVTYSAGANGTLTATVTSGTEVEKGTSVTFTATPDAGYKLKEWTVNGTPQASKAATLTLTIEAKTDVKVAFEQEESVEALAAEAVKVYPNPAGNVLHVAGLAPAAEVRLVSLSGAVVATAQADEAGRVTLDVSTLPEGDYLLLTPAATRKVVIRR